MPTVHHCCPRYYFRERSYVQKMSSVIIELTWAILEFGFTVYPLDLLLKAAFSDGPTSRHNGMAALGSSWKKSKHLLCYFAVHFICRQPLPPYKQSWQLLCSLGLRFLLPGRERCLGDLMPLWPKPWLANGTVLQDGEGDTALPQPPKCPGPDKEPSIKRNSIQLMSKWRTCANISS